VLAVSHSFQHHIRVRQGRITCWFSKTSLCLSPGSIPRQLHHRWNDARCRPFSRSLSESLPIAKECLSRNSKGQVVVQLRCAYRDGTTHIVMSAQEIMQCLPALVPRPRLHPIRFHGALASNVRLRSAVVPAPSQNATATGDDGKVTHSAPVRAWTCLWYGCTRLAMSVSFRGTRMSRVGRKCEFVESRS